MKIYPELKNQTFIRIPRSGLVQKYLPFTPFEETLVTDIWY